MNINLVDVLVTSKDGSKFWKIADCYVRGTNVKYMRLPQEVLDKVQNDMYILYI